MSIVKDLRIGQLNDIYGELLSARQSEVLREYFDFDLSYGEIAQMMGITRQAVGQVIETAARQLETLEDKLGLLKIADTLNQIATGLTDEQVRAKLIAIAEQICGK